MDPVSYPYRLACKPRSTVCVSRPFLDIVVASGDEKRSITALIDSGTDITMMNSTIAEILGITSTNKKTGEASGIGSVVRPGFFAPVTLLIPPFTKPLKINVLFVIDPDVSFDVLLGQDDFFRNFDITFRRSKDTFILQPIY